MRILLLLFLLFSLTATNAQGWLSPARTGSLRGIWVDAYGAGFKTEAEIDTLIADARALNLNTLFVQVVRRGDCYCLRSTLPIADDPALEPNFDPLSELIIDAHAAGMQVHAWVVTLALWGSDAVPSDPQHAYNLHGPDASEAESWLTMRYDGVVRPEADVYLDPGVPAVGDYLTDAVVGLVQNYDLDGIIFDRLRFPDYNLDGAPSWGYNVTSLARFAAETGEMDLPHPTDPLWTAWRRDQISLLERRLYLSAKAVNPDLWVGAATIVYGAPPTDFSESPAYNLVLQDWAGWLAGGFLDLNLPMNYKQNGDADEAEWFGDWNRVAPELAHQAATAVAAGIYRNDPEETNAQLEEVLSSTGLVGWSGYSYRTPSEAVALGIEDAETALDELAERLTAPGAPFAEAAAFGRPPPVTALTGRIESDGANVSAQTVELLSGDRVVATAQTDAAGRYGFVLDEAVTAPQVRLSGGVLVPLSLPEGRVTQAPTLTRAWYLAGKNPLKTY